MLFRPPKRAAEGDGRDHRSPEETDTNVDNPLFGATERRRTATFGPAVTSQPSVEERTETTVPQLDPTVPRTRLAAGRRSWAAVLAALAIGALLGLALVAAYASFR